jgi:hypothetical protein
MPSIIGCPQEPEIPILCDILLFLRGAEYRQVPSHITPVGISVGIKKWASSGWGDYLNGSHQSKLHDQPFQGRTGPDS